MSRPARSAIIAESVRAEERGMAYSMSILSIMLPGLFASVMGGFIVDKIGYIAVFLIAILIESLCFILFLSLEETLTDELKGEISLKDMFVLRKELLGFYVATAADIFAWGLGFALLFAILTASYGFTKFQLGLMYSLFVLAWISSQLHIGKLLGKYKCKTLLALSEFIGIFVLIGFLLSREFWLSALLHIPMGLVAAAWTPAMLTYAANAAPEEERAKVIGGLAAFRGLAGFMAPFIGGILYDKWGFSAPILANLLAVIATLGLIVILIRED
jgi:MFS family permease